MKFSIGCMPLLLALLEVNVDAFAPVGLSGRQSTTRAMDTSSLQDLPHHIQSFQDVISTFSIADLDPTAIANNVADVVQAVDPSGAAGDVAEVATKNGWFGFLTGPTMAFLELIHTGLNTVGLNSNSWGVSIIALTLSIKLLTFPLTKAQLESTQKMQVCNLILLLRVFICCRRSCHNILV